MQVAVNKVYTNVWDNRYCTKGGGVFYPAHHATVDSDGVTILEAELQLHAPVW